MSLSPFPAMKSLPKNAASTKDVTLRDFSGGLRASANETNLRSKFSVIADNVFRDAEQGMVVRYGTKLLATCADDIVEMAYFENTVIAFLADGRIQTVNLAGTVVTIWDDTIAGALVGAPDGWSDGVEKISYTVFRGEMIVANGIDKPVIIAADLTVDYLQDVATGSNIYTPITSLVTTVSNYLVMADFNGTDEIFISSAGTSGTWPGDAAPNNAISLKLGAYTATAGSEIVAIADFRNNLVVFFEEYVLVLELDVFDEDGVHTPKVLDTLQDTKILNHRCMFTTNSEMVFAAQSGLQTFKQQQFSAQLAPKDLTDDLGDIYEKATAYLELTGTNSFIVRDPTDKRVFIFVAQQDGSFQAFAMSYKDDFKNVSWSTVSGWDFTGGLETAKKRVVFFKDDKVYLYGNGMIDGEDYYADFITDASDGTPITFNWELPWLDANSRMRSKQLLNVALETRGTAAFSMQLFIDNFYKDLNNALTPVMEMAFRGGDTPGFGTDVGGFGGGRRTNDERMYKLPSKFNILKLRFSGQTRAALKFSSISLIYAKAKGFRR